MTADEAALWRTVLDRPADDLARLVYADYLEDHGRGPLARFIRAQIRLASAPPGHPDYADAVEAQSLAVAGVRAASSLPVPDLPDGVTFAGNVSEAEEDGYGSYRRGFPDRVTFNGLHHRTDPGCLARSLAAVVAGTTVREVAAVYVSASGVEELVGSAAAAALTGLGVEPTRSELAGCAAALAGGGNPLRVTRLTLGVGSDVGGRPGAWFNVRDPAPGPADWSALAAAAWVPRLTHLDAAAGDGFAALAGAVGPALSSLTLRDLRAADVQYLERVPAARLAGLRTLRLPGAVVDDRTAARLATLPLPAVAALRLPTPVAGGAALARLLVAPWLAGLTEFALTGNRAAVVLPLVNCGPAAERLRLLILDGPVDGPDDLAALGRPGAFPRLTTLSVRRAQSRTNADVAHFAEAWSGHLHTLILKGWPVTAAAAQRFAANPVFASLKRLKLRGCKLGDAAAATLLTSPHLQGLVELDFAMNAVGERTAAALMRADTLPNLLLADLTGNRMRPDTRNKLRAARAGAWA